MRHARPEDLVPLTDLLASLRELEGLTERKPGTFYRQSNAFLHFHADDAGLFADLKEHGEFERYRVTTKGEQQALLTRANAPSTPNPFWRRRSRSWRLVPTPEPMVSQAAAELSVHEHGC